MAACGQAGGQARAAEIVFRQPLGGQRADQPLGPVPRRLGQGAGGLDQRLQPRGARGIVVNAQIVADEAEGRDQIGTEPAAGVGLARRTRDRDPGADRLGDLDPHQVA